jgi:hypothetical protein
MRGKKIKKIKFEEEILMIYKFQYILVSQNEHLFSNPKMVLYCQTASVMKYKEATEKMINKKLKSKRYFFYHKSFRSN